MISGVEKYEPECSPLLLTYWSLLRPQPEDKKSILHAHVTSVQTEVHTVKHKHFLGPLNQEVIFMGGYHERKKMQTAIKLRQNTVS